MDARQIRMRMPSWVVPATSVCFVIGGLLALQFTSQRNAGLPPRGGRADVLAQILVASQSEADKQKEEIKQLRAQLNELRDVSTQAEKVNALLNKEVTKSQVALGLVEVSGPGVIIAIADSKLASEPGENKEPFLLHDYDLWPLVNELRAAGAEAISINGQRVVGATAIRCSGPVLKINDAPVTSPFTIKAIGDPDALAGAINIPGGVVEQLQAYKFPVKVQTQKDIIIEAVGVSPELRYAKPVPPAR
jgi:uncharacterized protein YlxW (UPF0749 family)